MLNNGTEYQHALQEGADPKGNVVKITCLLFVHDAHEITSFNSKPKSPTV